MAGWLEGVAQADFREEVASELASEAPVELELVVKGTGGKIPNEGDAGLLWGVRWVMGERWIILTGAVTGQRGGGEGDGCQLQGPWKVVRVAGYPRVLAEVGWGGVLGGVAEDC